MLSKNIILNRPSLVQFLLKNIRVVPNYVDKFHSEHSFVLTTLRKKYLTLHVYFNQKPDTVQASLIYKLIHEKP